jgi:hypothetical protein
MRRNKVFWKSVLLALSVAAGMAQPQARAGEPRMFEGVDLSKLRQVQSLRAMPELYELKETPAKASARLECSPCLYELRHPLCRHRLYDFYRTTVRDN